MLSKFRNRVNSPQAILSLLPDSISCYQRKKVERNVNLFPFTKSQVMYAHHLLVELLDRWMRMDVDGYGPSFEALSFSRSFCPGHKFTPKVKLSSGKHLTHTWAIAILLISYL